jgi:hypothetical protein
VKLPFISPTNHSAGVGCASAAVVIRAAIRQRYWVQYNSFPLAFCQAEDANKAKAIPVTGLGGLKGCEMLRIPHCLDNRLIDGGKVVSPTHQPYFTPQKHYYFNVSGTHFC